MRRRNVILLLVVVILTTVVAASPARAAVEPLRDVPDRLVFEGFGEEGVDLFVMRSDGSEVRQLTDDRYRHFAPTWSPDGTRVAFLGAALHVMDAFGRNERRVAERAHDFDWSPDGQRLVYAFEDAVYVVEADGSDDQTVVTGLTVTNVLGEEVPADRIEVDWAPRGERIALRVTSFAEEAPVQETKLVDADGSDRQTIPGFLNWAPDGMRFASTTNESGEERLWVADAQDPAQRTVVDGGAGLDFSEVRWSPEGDRLAYKVDGASNEGEVRVADLRSGAVRVAVVGPGGNLRWSPEGQRIAYTREETVQVVDLPTGASSQLAQFTLSEFGELGIPGWTSDGEAVVVRVWPQFEVRDAALYRVAADGSGAQRLPDVHRGYVVGVDIAPARFGVTERAMGADRVATAVELSRRAFSAASMVVVARADAYPDALAGAGLAGRLDAPLLLTPGHKLLPVVAGEVARLGARTAVVLGTGDVVSEQVVADLRAAGVETVRRIGGDDRFATAALVAGELESRQVFVVEGLHADPARGWPDAIAVSPVAAHLEAPLLFTLHDRLPEATRQALADLNPGRVVIVGGPQAVSEAVADQVADASGTVVERWAGDDRYETSALVAERAVAAGMDPARAVLVTGANWPDALAAGPATATVGGVQLLAPPRGLPADGPTAGWLTSRPVQEALLVGGPTALNPAVASDVNRLLERP